MPAGSLHPLTRDETRECQSELGKFHWLSTVSRPDTCACLAHLVSEVNVLHVGDIHRTRDQEKAIEHWRPAKTSKYRANLGTQDIRLGRWPNAAHQDQAEDA